MRKICLFLLLVCALFGWGENDSFAMSDYEWCVTVCERDPVETDCRKVCYYVDRYSRYNPDLTMPEQVSYCRRFPGRGLRQGCIAYFRLDEKVLRQRHSRTIPLR